MQSLSNINKSPIGYLSSIIEMIMYLLYSSIKGLIILGLYNVGTMYILSKLFWSENMLRKIIN